MNEGAFIIVEGPVFDGPRTAAAHFCARSWFAEDPTNWWVPTMACLREWLDCTFFDVVSEFSSKANLGPPAAASETAPPSRSAWQRLRAAWTALRGGAPVEVPPAESQDRISLIARATSVAERLARRTKVQGLPPLLPAAGITRDAVEGFCAAASAFAAAAPWRRVPSDRAIKLDCLPLRPEPAFLMVLGQGTSERGLVIHFQRPGFAMAVQGLLLGEQVTWPPFLALFYSGAAELSPGEAQALSEHGCAIADGSSPFALFNDGHGGTSRTRSDTAAPRPPGRTSWYRSPEARSG